MKGTIVIAVREMVQQRFGTKAWSEALQAAGIDKEPLIAPSSMMDDAVVMQVIQGICRTTGKSMQQFADMFGEYWVCEYAQRLYKTFLSARKTRGNFYSRWTLRTSQSLMPFLMLLHLASTTSGRMITLSS